MIANLRLCNARIGELCVLLTSRPRINIRRLGTLAAVYSHRPRRGARNERGK